MAIYKFSTTVKKIQIKAKSMPNKKSGKNTNGNKLEKNGKFTDGN